MLNRCFIIFVFLACGITDTFGKSCVQGRGRFGKQLACSGFTTEQDLGEHIKGKLNKGLDEFLLRNSNLRYLSHDLLYGTKIWAVSIFNTTLMSLSDTDAAFEGLENTLEVVMVDQSTSVCHWNWNQAKYHKRLRQILISNSTIEYVPKLPNFVSGVMKSIYCEHCGIQKLAPEVFREVQDLFQLRLDHNDIVNVQRSMFPEVARVLHLLDLSYNKLMALPGDIFTKMPQLQRVYLNNNLMHTMEEEVFRPIWHPRIDLRLEGNELVCDCSLKWILRVQRIDFTAECAKPIKLRGKKVQSLDTGDLWC